MSGSAVGLFGSARNLVSGTTPTIVNQGFVDDGGPNLMRLPMGSLPDQNRLTRFSLAMTAELVGVSSPDSNVRPGFTGIFIVVKNSGLTRWKYARGSVCASVVLSPSAE